MLSHDDQGLVFEQGIQEGPQVDSWIGRIDAPVDEVTEFKIWFAELGAFSFDDTGSTTVAHEHDHWSRQAMQLLWKALP